MEASGQYSRGMLSRLTVVDTISYGWEMIKSNLKLAGFYVLAILIIQYMTTFLLDHFGWTEEGRVST